ncbi:MAG: hypothetical protein PBU97_03070 [Stenotrophomonas maltophilia]
MAGCQRQKRIPDRLQPALYFVGHFRQKDVALHQRRLQCGHLCHGIFAEPCLQQAAQRPVEGALHEQCKI